MYSPRVETGVGGKVGEITRQGYGGRGMHEENTWIGIQREDMEIMVGDNKEIGDRTWHCQAYNSDISGTVLCITDLELTGEKLN